MADYTCGVMNHPVGCMCPGKEPPNKDVKFPGFGNPNRGYQHDPMKGASVLIDYKENVDKGKSYVAEVLDSLRQKLSSCETLLTNVKSYPMEHHAAVDPLSGVLALEGELSRLERKLKLCRLNEVILTKKQEIAEAEEEFKKVQERIFINESR